MQFFTYNLDPNSIAWVSYHFLLPILKSTDGNKMLAELQLECCQDKRGERKSKNNLAQSSSTPEKPAKCDKKSSLYLASTLKLELILY